MAQRGRPKKNSDKTELTQQELFDVLEFARSIYTGSNMYQSNVYTPDLVNARMKEMNLHPLAATESGIESALKDPTNQEDQLVGYSEFFFLTSMTYKRLASYIAKMPSFDYTWVCTNATSKDKKTKAYKEDLDVLYRFLDGFDVRGEFKKVMDDLMVHETYYGVLRDESDENVVFQQLPYSQCKTVGKSEISPILFDFNMMYFFNQAGISLNMYPEIFQKMYQRVLDAKNNGYNPANSLDSRTGEWVYWCQTSPIDGFWGFKFDLVNATRIPYFSPLFSDVVLAPLYRNLQKNINILKAQKVVVGLIPYLKDTRGANVKDALALDPKTMGSFLGFLKAGLSDAIKISGLPFSDLKTVDFDTANPNIMDDYNKVTSATSGNNGRLVYSTDKMANFESQASLDSDSILATSVYPQFNRFMEYQINKRTKKYKFKWLFEGTEYQFNRQFRFDLQMKLCDKGIVLPQKIAASIGMSPQDMLRQLEDAKDSGFADKLITIINPYTQSGKDVGRTKKADSELGEAGATTRDYGTNE